ncbi:MAG: Eco57I restriction-modification methylase domain-containing protein [Treponema sp.]|nr:Eco57I restriction-modification methylase domain-containing protein [Treponema sp.]
MTAATNLRTLFENKYPGKDRIFSEVIKPIFDKAKDATLTDNQQLSESDKRLVKSFSIIAQVRGGFPITFADVELKDTVALKRSRVAIQNCVRKIMTNDSSAIIFFHFTDNTKDWRVSFVNKGESGKDSTNAKRYTYLCGVNHGCRTIAERFNALAKLDRITDKDMISAFSVESLTKEFFGQLFTWYSDWACKVCKFPSDKCIAANADLTTEKNEINLIRLITRIMFVWFIKQKNLIPTWIFNKNELAEILTDADLSSDKKGNYYNAVLQNLFFGALNKKIEERAFAEVSKAGVANEQYGIKTYFRDANEGSFFKLSPKEMVKKFLDVPFLNGGLFECLDWDEPTKNNTSHKVHYVDGFSRDKDRRAFVPNVLFWNEDEKQPGLITILSRYNFTVEESTPSDVQVALDPELLGKIFENLLGTYNPETRESARKESGSFYTPREIVSYMENSSIKAYLQEKVPDVSEENLERLTNDNKADDSEIKLTEEQINKIRSALFEIKIIDPACGSGAFPMGILNKLVEIHVLLDKLSASTKSEHNLYIKKGQSVNYNPDESLKINAEYLGNQEFKLCVNGKEENTIYNSQDLALHVKEIINRHNKKLGKSTIANLFSQGRIDDGKSFNSIKTKTDIHQIVDEDTKDIIWQYRSYNVKNKFRQYRNEEKPALSIDAAEEDNDFEYAKYLYSLKTRIIQDSIFGVDIQPIAVQISKLRFFISLICEQPKIENHPEENYGYNPLPNLETKFVAANTLIGKAKKTDDMALFANPRIDEITKKLGEIRKVHFSAKTAQEKKENREEDEKLRKELSKLLEEDQVYSPEDAKQLAAWNPYDQSAPASSFFDAEWMFGIKDGFDIVIGNPPYVQVKKKIFSADVYPYSEGKDVGKQNLYKVFVEASYNLLKENGISTLIIQSSLMCDMSSAYTRELLLTKTIIKQIIEFPKVAPHENSQVFKAVLQGTCISIFMKKTPNANTEFGISINNDTSTINSLDFEPANQFALKEYFSSRYEIPLIKRGEMNIISKVKDNQKLAKMISDSLQGNINTIYLKDIQSNEKTDIFIAKGANVHKYYIDNDVFFGKKSLQVKNLVKRNSDAGAVLVTQNITGTTDKFRIHAAYAECKNTDFVFLDSVNILYLPNPSFAKFALALLNSKLLDWLFRKTSTNNHCNMYELVDLPIPSATPAQQKPIIALVDKILAAKKANPQVDTSKEEHKIDLMVYHLYGLSFDEAKIIDADLTEEEFNG